MRGDLRNSAPQTFQTFTQAPVTTPFRQQTNFAPSRFPTQPRPALTGVNRVLKINRRIFRPRPAQTGFTVGFRKIDGKMAQYSNNRNEFLSFSNSSNEASKAKARPSTISPRRARIGSSRRYLRPPRVRSSQVKYQGKSCEIRGKITFF